MNLEQGASGHHNYCHWLLDMLPKLKIYNEIYDFKNLDNIYVSELNEFQRSSLKLLGLNSIKIINSKKYRHIQSDEVIGTSHPNYYKGFILKEQKFMPRWIIKWLRQSFLKKVKKKDKKLNIFIDRSDSISKHCQIINNQEIKDKLKKNEQISFVLCNK